MCLDVGMLEGLSFGHYMYQHNIQQKMINNYYILVYKLNYCTRYIYIVECNNYYINVISIIIIKKYKLTLILSYEHYNYLSEIFHCRENQLQVYIYIIT